MNCTTSPYLVFSSFCEEGLPNLNELTTDNVVEAVVRFLWACDPKFTKTIQSYSMSSQTTARFKMATTLAQALKVNCRSFICYLLFFLYRIWAFVMSSAIKPFYITVFLMYDEYFWRWLISCRRNPLYRKLI